jgi:ABC-2 type transport system permease protein
MSMVPIFSTSLMPVRIVAGDAPAWQIILSFVLLIGTGYLILKASARIYRNAIMQQGKELKMKDIFKLLKKA